MYAAYYRFTGAPFQLTPDSRFFFGSRGHSRAHLASGVRPGAAGRLHHHHRRGRRRQDDAGGAALVAARPPHLRDRAHGHDAGLRRRPAAAGRGRFRPSDDGGADKATLLRRLERMFRDERADRAALPAGRGRGAEPVAACARGAADAVQHHDRRARRRCRPSCSASRSSGRRSRAPTSISSASACWRPIISARSSEEETARLYRAPAADGRLERQSAPGRRPRSSASIAIPAAFRAGSTRFVRACCSTARSRRRRDHRRRWWSMTAAELRAGSRRSASRRAAARRRARRDGDAARSWLPRVSGAGGRRSRGRSASSAACSICLAASVTHGEPR